ncbi:MAG: translation initiation factor IF-2 [Christensenellaceae bacterium]|nr:translation initiation factor IF-2 [Christensenellaceae bacterium]
MAYLTDVDKKVGNTQKASRKQITDAKALQSVLLERIKTRDELKAKQAEEAKAAEQQAIENAKIAAAEAAEAAKKAEQERKAAEEVKKAKILDEKQQQRIEERRAKAHAEPAPEAEKTEERPARQPREARDFREQKPFNKQQGQQQGKNNFRDNKQGIFQGREGRDNNRPGKDNRNQAARGGFNPMKDKDADERPQQPQRRNDRPRQNSGGGMMPVIPQQRNPHDKQKDRQVEEKRQKKGALKERGVFDDDEFAAGSRKIRKGDKKQKTHSAAPEPIVIEKAVIYGESVSIKVFAEKIGKPVAQIIKKLVMLGMMNTNINSEIDFDTANLVASDFDIELEQKIEQTAEDAMIAEDKEDNEDDLVIRPPVVTIMGHVDHGKTSILDAIRKTSVQASEAGGITQHIGAYTVSVGNRSITFLDTPGHEAFTSMRARGANVTDIAVLVVAANDGVMPQTVEAINHAKAAGVPIIVAINKIDIPGSSADMVKQELTEYGLIAEEWGGETIMVPLSAKTKEGLSDLLEMILLVADVNEFKANPNRLAKGAIVEARLDRGRGPVATVLVQNGTLKVSDTVVAGTAYGRIRAMVDDKGRTVKKAGPSQPVEVIGFSEVPSAGDTLYVVDEKLSRQVVQERIDRQKAERMKSMSKVTLDDLFSQIEKGNIKELNIVVKADVQGSVEAVRQSLEKISNDEVRVRVIHGAVGAISENDIMLASAANAIIIGFNVRPEASVMAVAEREKVDVRTYRIIYNAIDDVTKAMAGMLEPEFKEEIQGHAEVRQTFRVSGVGTIIGGYMLDGKMTRNSEIRLVRDGVVVYEGKLNSLRRFKDDVREVANGYEFGASLQNYNDIKEGDILEAFAVVKIEKEL